MLFIGEITDGLKGENIELEFIGFDACIMGSAEIAYQFRPSPENDSIQANYMIASAGNEWAYGWNFIDIFARLRTGNRGGRFIDPKTMTGACFGNLVVETYADYINSFNNGRPLRQQVRDQTMSSYDLSKIECLKIAIDNLAVQLSKDNAKQAACNLRGYFSSTNVMNYFDPINEWEWRSYPFFDIYDFCNQMMTNPVHSPNFSEEAKELAGKVREKVSQVIISSWGDTISYPGFESGKNGMFFFFPDGDRLHQGSSHWSRQTWYFPYKLTSGSGYGNLLWCRDGIDPEINSVGNWFELLDSWFNPNNIPRPGTGGFRW
jgi:clostripain